jgi:hypothetical protein
LALAEGAANEVHKWIWIPSEYPMRRTMDYVASGDEGDGALMVALESRSIGVVSVTIGFDDEALRGPIEVDKKPLNQDVHLRERYAEFATERQEIDLRIREGLDRAWVDFHRHSPQAANPLLSPPAGDHLLQYWPTHASVLVSGHQRPLKLLCVQACGHVQQRALRRRYGNAAFHGDMSIWQRPGLMQADSGSPAMNPAGATKHLDVAPRSAHAPEIHRAPMRKDGARPRRKDGRHQSSLPSDAFVTKREDPLEDRNQNAGFGSILIQPPT